MDIYADRLASHLQSQLLPIYMVSGDEPLIQQECCDMIRNAAKQAGYEERQVYHVDAKFDWDSLIAEAQSMSLFANKKIIELRMPSGKPGVAGSNALQEWCTMLPEDNLLLISSGKLEGSAKNSKWAKAIGPLGGMIQVWPINSRDLPRWVAQRLQQANIHVDSEALAILVAHVEGNLLAAHQEITKLQLDSAAADQSNETTITETIDAESMRRRISDHARFDVFQMIDTALQGQLHDSLRMLRGLKMEGLKEMNIAAPLFNEIDRLSHFANLMQQGHLNDGNMMKRGVWKSRQPAVRKALQRLNVESIQQLLVQCKNIDNGIKGLQKIDIWLEFEDLICQLAGQFVRSTSTRQLCQQRYQLAY